MKRLEVTLENPNGILIDLTAEEITQKKTDEAQAVTDKQTREAAATTAATKKASGKAKLKALGLDDEEIKNLGL